MALSHTQYEELRKYEDERPHWIDGRAHIPLAARGFLSETASAGFYAITESGISGLVAYRERWGIKVAAVREP